MRFPVRFLVWGSALLLFGGAAAVAGPIARKDLGASNNGVGLSFAACNTPGFENCGQYSSGPFETLDGAQVYTFVINDGSDTLAGIHIYDVFQLPGTIAAGSQLVLNLNNINQPFGNFACANGTGGPIDSMGSALDGSCTVGDIGPLGAFLSETDSGNTATIGFSGSGLPSSWTFYTLYGNLASFSVTSGSGSGGGSTSTPEPATVSLLCAGLAGLGLATLKIRR